MASDNHLYYLTGFKITYTEGDRSLQRVPLKFNNLQSDYYHTVVDGETLTSIASRRYGDSQLWYIIADANSILNPFDDIEVGLSLRIPTGEAIDKFNNDSDTKRIL